MNGLFLLTPMDQVRTERPERSRKSDACRRSDLVETIKPKGGGRLRFRCSCCRIERTGKGIVLNGCLASWRTIPCSLLNCLNTRNFHLRWANFPSLLLNRFLFWWANRITFQAIGDSWDILENYSRATFAVLDRAGHRLQIEQEELFNALVNEWLDRVEESIERQQS